LSTRGESEVDIPLFDSRQAPIPTPEGGEEQMVRSASPRYQRPNRAQVDLRGCGLEDLIAEDHPVRTVWAFVEDLDLSPLYQRIGQCRAERDARRLTLPS
jgi:hypothetical protein